MWCICSFVYPLRFRPTELTPAYESGSLAAFTKGGMSFLTKDPPPVKKDQTLNDLSHHMGYDENRDLRGFENSILDGLPNTLANCKVENFYSFLESRNNKQINKEHDHGGRTSLSASAHYLGIFARHGQHLPFHLEISA